MAGIEKICEFSGEYPAHLMYGYKKNQLQIMPKYRKNFRGVKAKLYVHFKRFVWEWRDIGGKTNYFEGDMKSYIPAFTDKNEWITYEKEVNKKRLLKEYSYVLSVEDESLKGEVDGKYLNYTTHLPTVKRKLKRLLRCKDLEIVYVESKEDFDSLCY